MICPKLIVSLFCIACLSTPAQAERAAADIITMKNGNIHIGQIQQALFDLRTLYGELRISPQDISRISPVSKSANVRVTTHFGERITGKLKQTEIMISRLQDPGIPINFEEVARIDLGNPLHIEPAPQYISRLETTGGDTLQVHFEPTTLTLETQNGPVILDATQLRLLDTVQRTDEEAPLTQAVLEDGRIIQGRLINSNVSLSSAYLDSMNLPVTQLSRLSLKASTPRNHSPATFADSMHSLGSGPEMIAIKGGRFLRGDQQGDGDDDEHPLAEVTLKPYAIGQFEITFEQYDLFCEQTHCDLPDDQEWGRGNRPVVNVSWEDASAYVQWLSEKTGKPYRLPSDAEWEYAHRAGEMTRYGWGNEVEFARANCEGCGSLWDGDQTAPVGRFPANALGLYDSAGNVFEWVADCFHDRFADAPSDGSPVVKPGCGKRVIRGGAWSFPPHELRSANRWRDFPARRSDDTGFRVAMDWATD